METVNPSKTPPPTTDTSSSPTSVAVPSATPSTSPPSPEPKAETQKKPAPPPLFNAPKKKRKWIKWLVILGLIIGGSYQFVVLPLKEAGQQLMASAYIAEKVTIEDLTLSVSSTGTVTPIDSYNVTALVTGDILNAPFEEGGQVEKGQILYQFDSYTGSNNLQNAILNLERANLTYQTTQESLIPYATGTGIIQSLQVQVGDSVSMGSVIATIVDSSSMTVKIPFHASQVEEFYVGQSASITLESTFEQLPATIVSISGAEEIGAGNVILRQVEFRVANPGALPDGALATASVVTSSGTIFSASTGSFRNQLSHTVTASTSGEITALHVSEGSFVNTGDTIATIGGSNAFSTLESARISVDTARLSVESAEKAMENYTVTSPISGTVIQKNFKQGDTLDSASLSAAGGNLAVIYDMTTLTFEMNIHELDINKIQVGQQVKITADAVEGAEYTGYVDNLSIGGITSGGMTSYPITVVITDPDLLKPGMNVSAEVIMDSIGEVLAIPLDAVIRGEDGSYVLLASEGAVDEIGMVIDHTLLERVKVELGPNDNHYIQVLSGLEEGDYVAWENQVVNPFASMMGPTR